MRRPAHGARRPLTGPLLAVAVGAVLLGAGGGLAAIGGAATFGAASAQALDRATGPTPSVLLPAALTAPRPAGPRTTSARLADQPRVQVDAPVRLSLAGAALRVVPVGLAVGGQVEVPEDVTTAGWWRFGPAPGDPQGSAVLVGHVDDRLQGVGVFAELRALRAGDPVEVRRGSGRIVRYRVVAREQWSKEDAPMQRLFASTGAPRLVLISCAGRFDERTGRYSDNVAVTAVPA